MNETSIVAVLSLLKPGIVRTTSCSYIVVVLVVVAVVVGGQTRAQIWMGTIQTPRAHFTKISRSCLRTEQKRHDHGGLQKYCRFERVEQNQPGGCETVRSASGKHFRVSCHEANTVPLLHTTTGIAWSWLAKDERRGIIWSGGDYLA